MPITIEKLRRWTLLAAVLIVAGVALLLLFARYEQRKLLHDLPSKLGVDIQQQTNEFTYSQSVQGHTLFTLHAAKAVQMKQGGNIKLHDVTIILYGKDQTRADRIAGDEFDYDPNSGIARAAGDVFLDLQAPTKAVTASVKSTAAADATTNLSGSTVHVTTHGLVFQQKQGIASTADEITFQFGHGVTGHAHGAQYDSSRGIITLDSAVAADTILHGKAVRLTASHGELNRDTNLCVFTHASYIAEGETATADTATIQLRTDGSAERVDTTGNVTLTLARGGTIQTPHTVLLLNAASEPKDMQANSGIHYADKGSTANGAHEAQGDAAAAHVLFDNNGLAQTADLSGDVHALERDKQNSAADWTERELHAATLHLVFHSAVGTPTTLHEARAEGSAQMRLSAPGAKGTETNTASADTLDALFGTGALPQTIHGTGHTILTQTNPNGAMNESHGDTLDVQLHAKPKSKAASRSAATPRIDRAVQQGHVTLTQTPAAKNTAVHANAQPMTATAGRADYTGSDDALVLTGNPQSNTQPDPQIIDGALQVAAHRIRLLRTSGDAVLTGNIRGNYAGAAQQPPAHVVADHGEMHRSDQHAIFYGAGRSSARLWQDASQVEAPVLDFDRAAQKLTAYGNANDPAAVHAVFTEASGSAKKTVSVVRVASRKMVYTTAATVRQADFTGGVAVESADATIKSQRALVELTPAETGKSQPSPAAAMPMLGGNVQRITASGQVALTESGRQGFGEQLVYTPNPTSPNPATAPANPNKAAGHFVLTGTAAAPPRLVDSAKGTVTGGSLIFNSGDDSVVVSGSGAGANSTAGRVHTVIKVDK
jgi:lipopolysaccharide export system protein LptA